MSSPSDERDPLGLAALLVIVVSAVPTAVLVLPNTAPAVMPQATRDLGLTGGQVGDFVRACGLALPALLLAVPIGAVAARRLPALGVLTAGLALLLGGEVAGSSVTSLPSVALVRVAEGAGAGTLLPAALVLSWERRERRTLAAVWAGLLVAALVLATPLAVTASLGADTWRTVLHPFPWAGSLALAGAGLYALVRSHRCPRRTTARLTERTQLVLPVVPAAGLAFLAVVTPYAWPTGVQLLVAGFALAGLLGLAIVGSRDIGTGSPAGYTVVMLATGLLAMPVAGPLTGLLGGAAGPPLLPFAAGAACALPAACLAVAVSRGCGRRAVLGGYGLGATAVLFLLVGTNEPLAALCALGGGLGLATGAALRQADVAPALFGLALCFPAALTGFMVVGSLQVARVGAVREGGDTQTLAALTAAYDVWLLAAALIVVVLAGATAWVSRRPGHSRIVPQRDGGVLRAG